MAIVERDIDTIAAALEREGWCVVGDFFKPDATAALAHECEAFAHAGVLVPAATGRGNQRAFSNLRGDSTRWFESHSLTPPQTLYWSRMEVLRAMLNRRLLLGLESLEAHYSLYAPGTGYARHRDRFRDNDARVLSSVVYLNAGWRPRNGGALRLHLPDGPRDIMPTGGSLALFLSAEIEHEVLPAMRERMSIAGWFRRR